VNQKRSRLQRKAARLARKDRDSDRDKELAAARRERDAALAKAGAEFRKRVDEARDEHAKARAKAWETYDRDRARILKEVAAA
jgi:hypothetical protein